MQKASFTREEVFHKFLNNEFGLVGRTYEREMSAEILPGLTGVPKKRLEQLAKKRQCFARILAFPTKYDFPEFMQRLGKPRIYDKKDDEEIARASESPLGILTLMDSMSEAVGRNDPFYDVTLGKTRLRITHKAEEQVLYFIKMPNKVRARSILEYNRFTAPFLSYKEGDGNVILGSALNKGEQLPSHLKQIVGLVMDEKYTKPQVPGTN